MRSRDALAWRMGLGGYSAQEIADVLGGHLTLGDLQQARARLLAGRARTDVAAFLERQWRPAAALGVDPWQPLDNLRGGSAYLDAISARYPLP